MPVDSQTLAALAIVALAIGSLLRRWLGSGAATSCGGCSGCASGSVASIEKSHDQQRVYQLDASLGSQRDGQSR